MKIKNLLSPFFVLLIVILTTECMEAKDKRLPAPSFTGGMPVNEAFAARKSTREFDPAHKIEDSVLSQLLWMTLGVNRPDAPESKFGAAADRTNPTARNWQEIRAFVFGKDGIWEYQPKTHVLTSVKEGDYRSLLAGTPEFSQEFVVGAPYSIVFVADLTGLPETEQVKAMALVDIGIACENLNLACSSLGVATVPRATMDIDGVARLLGLSKHQIPVINNPIGYSK